MKVFPCLTKLHAFLNSALHGDEWLASCSGRLIAEKRAHWMLNDPPEKVWTLCWRQNPVAAGNRTLLVQRRFLYCEHGNEPLDSTKTKVTQCLSIKRSMGKTRKRRTEDLQTRCGQLRSKGGGWLVSSLASYFTNQSINHSVTKGNRTWNRTHFTGSDFNRELETTEQNLGRILKTIKQLKCAKQHNSPRSTNSCHCLRPPSVRRYTL